MSHVKCGQCHNYLWDKHISGQNSALRSGQIFSGQSSDFSSPALSLIFQSSWIRDTWEIFNSSLFMWCKHANGGISNINSHNIFTCEIEIRADCSKNHCSATHWRIYVTMRQKLLGFFFMIFKRKIKTFKTHKLLSLRISVDQNTAIKTLQLSFYESCLDYNILWRRSG